MCGEVVGEFAEGAGGPGVNFERRRGGGGGSGGGRGEVVESVGGLVWHCGWGKAFEEGRRRTRERRPGAGRILGGRALCSAGLHCLLVMPLEGKLRGLRISRSWLGFDGAGEALNVGSQLRDEFAFNAERFV